MKKNRISKKVVAVVLSVVMILSSLPFMIFSAIGEGTYDPAPYWGDDQNDKYGAINTRFIATLNADSSLSIAFPHANAAATWDTYLAGNPTRKTITNYIFTITKMEDDGTQTEIWSENFNLSSAEGRVGTFSVDNSAGNEYPNSIYYWPGAFTSLGEYEAEASYDIAIQAVDSDGWVSDKIHTLLTETPYYIINDDFSPNESWVVREMLLFEGSGNAQINEAKQSSNGTSGSMYSEMGTGNWDQDQIDYLYNANGLVDANGKFSGMGYNNSNAYRLWVNSAFSGTPFNFEATYSRTHYDFRGAEEVWFYVDMTRVNFGKVAFTVSANEKIIRHLRDNTTKTVSMYGDTFSTAAVNGVNTGTISEGIYIQNEDGLWETTSMTDGYFTDLGGYKGFIRIPIDYFILQSDQYLTGETSVETWWSDAGGKDCDSAYDKNDTNLRTYVTNESVHVNDKAIMPDGTTRNAVAYSGGPAGYGILINPAGTSVNDAIVLYDRWESYNTFGSETIVSGIRCVASGVTESVSNGAITYTISNDTQYAIGDLVSAGITVSDWTADTVHKSFYIDQVMFCQKNTGGTFDDAGYVTSASSVKFPQEGATVNASGTADMGRKMAGFYDRTVEVPKAVAQYILQYFGEIASLNDLNAKSIIDDIILEYSECFGIPANSTLTDEAKVKQAVEKLNTLGHTEAYNRYKTAEAFVNYLNSNDASTNNSAVIYFENTVENLPKGEFADHTDEELKETLRTLMAIYETFNLSHHELLGEDSEDKFLELYGLVMGEDVKTGQSIGAYPFIPFNDFETNYTYGQYSDMYYDDTNRSGNKAADVNNTGNFTTYVSDDVIDQPGEVGGTAIGWSPMDYRPTGDPTFGNAADFSKFDAQITNDGFNGSLAPRLNLKGNLVCNPEGNDWAIATLSTTYLGAEAGSWGALPGLDLSGIAVKGDSSNGTDAEDVTRYGEGVIPNSFVMYVDFTKVTNLNLNIKFIISDSSGTDYNCYFCGGKETETPVIYLLDENGEWKAEKLKVTQTDIEAASTLVRNVDPGLCTIAPSDLNSLQGYKGFIRIPLSNFRIPSYSGLANINVDFKILDNILDEGYKIKQAKISVWDEAGNNQGSSIIIDSLGFTYDPACTNRVSGNTDCNGELNQDNGIDIKNMDEYFGVKTTDSSNFEKMVSTIDPYATEEEFKKSYEACRDAYIALSEYQKGLDEVKYTYHEILVAKYESLYLDYANEINKEQWKPLYTATDDSTAVAKLQNDLYALSDRSKDYSTKEETMLDLYNEHKDDYLSALGFNSVEDAQKVIDMYELGYHRLSMADRKAISQNDMSALENAYNAARRAVEVTQIIADVEEFKAGIRNIYGKISHPDADADRIPDTEDTDKPTNAVSYNATVTVKGEDGVERTVNALEYYTDMYTKISVFGKMLLNDDTNTAAGYMNMYAAAEGILDNSTKITPFAGASVDGGIITYEDRLEAAYTDVSAKIANRAVLDDATLKEVEYCLGQYEALLRRYALVDELNYDYVQLALLFPVADLATTDEAYLTNADTGPVYSYTADADLTYVAARLGRSVSVYLVTDYKWTQVTGSTYNFGYFSVNGATGTDGTTAYVKLNDYENGATANIQPIISVNESDAKKVPTGNAYTGKITIAAYDSAMITDGVDISTLVPVASVDIPVTFESVNGSDPLTYVVSFPATQEIEWDKTTPTDVSYQVSANLSDNVLDVSVADADPDGNDKVDMVSTKADASGEKFALEYTATNFKTTSFTGTVENQKPADAPTITISQATWDSVPVGEYRTQLTYSVALGSGT